MCQCGSPTMCVSMVLLLCESVWFSYCESVWFSYVCVSMVLLLCVCQYGSPGVCVSVVLLRTKTKAKRSCGNPNFPAEVRNVLTLSGSLTRKLVTANSVSRVSDQNGVSRLYIIVEIYTFGHCTLGHCSPCGSLEHYLEFSKFS